MWRFFHLNILNSFVHNHQTLCFPAACLDEVDAVLVLGGRDDHLRFLGEERVDLLTQCVVNAYYTKVFAFEGHALVGGIGV